MFYPTKLSASANQIQCFVSIVCRLCQSDKGLKSSRLQALQFGFSISHWMAVLYCWLALKKAGCVVQFEFKEGFYLKFGFSHCWRPWQAVRDNCLNQVHILTYCVIHILTSSQSPPQHYPAVLCHTTIDHGMETEKGWKFIAQICF